MIIARPIASDGTVVIQQSTGVALWKDGTITAVPLQGLFASVFTNNRESARVLEKCGFTLSYVAQKSAIKDGQIMDEWRYHLVRPE